MQKILLLSLLLLWGLGTNFLDHVSPVNNSDSGKKQVAQRATIAHLSIPICPKTLCSLSPHPKYAIHKIWSRLANWLQKYSSSKVWHFCHSRASNSKMSGLIRPKIELDRAFMPVLVTSNFDDYLIKNERASMETPFSYYQPMGNFLDAQGQLIP